MEMCRPEAEEDNASSAHQRLIAAVVPLCEVVSSPIQLHP